MTECLTSTEFSPNELEGTSAEPGQLDLVVGPTDLVVRVVGPVHCQAEDFITTVVHQDGSILRDLLQVEFAGGDAVEVGRGLGSGQRGIRGYREELLRRGVEEDLQVDLQVGDHEFPVGVGSHIVIYIPLLAGVGKVPRYRLALAVVARIAKS